MINIFSINAVLKELKYFLYIWKGQFYSSLKKFWVVQSSLPIIKKNTQVNLKWNVKTISTFGFIIFYTSLPDEH